MKGMMDSRPGINLVQEIHKSNLHQGLLEVNCSPDGLHPRLWTAFLKPFFIWLSHHRMFQPLWRHLVVQLFRCPVWHHYGTVWASGGGLYFENNKMALSGSKLLHDRGWERCWVEVLFHHALESGTVETMQIIVPFLCSWGSKAYGAWLVHCLRDQHRDLANIPIDP